MMLKTSVQTMTPERADELLRYTLGRVAQRRLSDKRVRDLVGVMERGEWQVTHQGIALSDDGAVLDGQHRLEAIRRHGHPVPIMVTEGVDPATFAVIDVGARRTLADTLHIAGHVNTATVGTAARYVMAWRAIETDPNLTWRQALDASTTSGILAFMDTDDGAAVRRSVSAGMRLANGWGRAGARTPAVAATALLSRSDVPDTLRLEFLERAADGVALTPGSPILALRRFMIQDGAQRLPHALRARTMLCMIVKAFNEYATHTPRQIMSFKVETEAQPRILTGEQITAALIARENAADA